MVSKQYVLKYPDEALCDIMLVACCYIILGSPWQYDRHVMYDGRLNEYTTWKNGVKVTLFPLIESPDEINCTTIRIFIVNGKQFEKEMKKK